jgi:hypothetical protein
MGCEAHPAGRDLSDRSQVDCAGKGRRKGVQMVDQVKEGMDYVVVRALDVLKMRAQLLRL